MKIFRCICIATLILGAIALLRPVETTFDILPFPGAGLHVKMAETIRAEGFYGLQLCMPVADDKIPLEAEIPTCLLLISMMGDQGPMIKEEIKVFRPASEFGFGRLRYYNSKQGWHLKPGGYNIEIESLQAAEEITKRGATLSLEADSMNTTESFLRRIFLAFAGKVLLIGGVVGLILCEAIGLYKKE